MYKKIYFVCIGLLLLSLSSFAQSKKNIRALVESLKAQVKELDPPLNLSDNNQKFGYATGALLFEDITKIGDEVDIDALYKGLKDSEKKELRLDKKELEKFLGEESMKKTPRKIAKNKEEIVYKEKEYKLSKKELIAEVTTLKALIHKLNPPLDLSDNDQKYTYAIGVIIFDRMAKLGGDIDIDAIHHGLKDGEKRVLKIDTETLKNFFDEEVKARAAKKLEEKRKAEKIFFDGNAKKEGVKTTPSGLQYKVLREGTGKKATIHTDVVVRYEGKFLDGKVFDKAEKPVTLNPRAVINGFTEGLLMMKEGAKYRLFVPYRLGYGEEGIGKEIPPFSTLIFEVELQKIK